MPFVWTYRLVWSSDSAPRLLKRSRSTRPTGFMGIEMISVLAGWYDIVLARAMRAVGDNEEDQLGGGGGHSTGVQVPCL